jgi:hypothetical protein
MITQPMIFSSSSKELRRLLRDVAKSFLLPVKDKSVFFHRPSSKVPDV